MSKAFEFATGRHEHEVGTCGDRPEGRGLVCTLPPHGPETRHEDERYGTTWRRLGDSGLAGGAQ